MRDSRRTVLAAMAIACASAVAIACAAIAGDAGARPRAHVDAGKEAAARTLTLWVDPSGGDDRAAGTTRRRAHRTLTAAWARLPASPPELTRGFRILLCDGAYRHGDEMPAAGWFEGRHGSAAHPVEIVAAPGASRVDLADMTFHDCSGITLRGLHLQARGGDVLHLSSCDSMAVRSCRLEGLGDIITYDCPQEALKANQCTGLTIDSCDISGAWGDAVDLFAVQGGSVTRNRIHRSLGWCMYVKGGSAALTIEGNEIYGADEGGFLAGQGSSFEFMVPPWLHYEAYDVRFVNNIVHDVTGPGMGVNGGYDVLLAFNTLYKVGARSHAIEVLHGVRGCGGDVETCRRYLRLGGWGTAVPGNEGAQPIPNRNVYIFNNVLLQPAGYRSAWAHFAFAPPSPTAPGSNIASPASASQGLVVRGNVIWNGPADLPLGGEWVPTEPGCGAAQLREENAINQWRPDLCDPAKGDFRPVQGARLALVVASPIPPFPGGDAPSRPVVPVGRLDNTVTRDLRGYLRGTTSPPGALLP
jgi:hypothetical protein